MGSSCSSILPPKFPVASSQFFLTLPGILFNNLNEGFARTESIRGNPFQPYGSIVAAIGDREHRRSRLADLFWQRPDNRSQWLGVAFLVFFITKT